MAAAPSWSREQFNGRFQWEASLLDRRWGVSQLYNFAKSTYFKEYTGPVTPFELCCIAIVFVGSIVPVLVMPVTTQGQITSYMIFIGVIVVMKNNILQLMLGISWERAILFHRACMIAALVCACIHGIPQLQMNSPADVYVSHQKFSGFLMFLLLCTQVLLYIFLKPFNHELFYYCHLAIYGVILYFATIHGANFIIYAVCITAADLLIRYLLFPLRVTATIQNKADDVVQVTFDRRWKRNVQAGQYVFIMVPSLGVHEWHPFSISSSPHDLKVTLHCSKVGGWTNALSQLAGSGASEVTAFVEGPYGVPSINLEDDTYKIIVLVSGGIGITPNQCIAQHALAAHEVGKPLKKVFYIWTLRKNKIGLIETMVDGGFYPRNQAVELQQPLRDGKREDEDLIATDSAIQSDPNMLCSHFYITGTTGSNVAANLPSNARAVAAAGDATIVPADSPEHAKSDVERGGRRANSEEEATLREKISESLKSTPHYVNFRRPDFMRVFQQVRQVAVEKQERRVGVCLCGPPMMIEDALAAARQISDSEVKFDLHVEVFRV